jgi:hypothetical protein
VTPGRRIALGQSLALSAEECQILLTRPAVALYFACAWHSPIESANPEASTYARR